MEASLCARVKATLETLSFLFGQGMIKGSVTMGNLKWHTSWFGARYDKRGPSSFKDYFPWGDCCCGSRALQTFQIYSAFVCLSLSDAAVCTVYHLLVQTGCLENFRVLLGFYFSAWLCPIESCHSISQLLKASNRLTCDCIRDLSQILCWRSLSFSWIFLKFVVVLSECVYFVNVIDLENCSRNPSMWVFHGSAVRADKSLRLFLMCFQKNQQHPLNAQSNEHVVPTI